MLEKNTFSRSFVYQELDGMCHKMDMISCQQTKVKSLVQIDAKFEFISRNLIEIFSKCLFLFLVRRLEFNFEYHKKSEVLID